MKTNTHKMAGTPAENGQLIIPELRNTSKKVASRRKKGTADPNAQCNTGTNIYNPFTGRYIGDKQYSKIRHEGGCDFKLLARNSHITGWDGTLSEEEFIALPESQVYLMGKIVDQTGLEEENKRWIADKHRRLEEELTVLTEVADTPSNTNHTAGTQSPVVTAKPAKEPCELSEFDIYNICVVQTQEIETLTGEVRKLGKLIDEDNELLVSMYHVGRKSVDALSALIDKVGSQIGINPCPPF